MVAYYNSGVTPPDYYSPDPARLEHLIFAAARRDNLMNAEERQAYNDSVTECELGPNWWLRAHP